MNLDLWDPCCFRNFQNMTQEVETLGTAATNIDHFCSSRDWLQFGSEESACIQLCGSSILTLSGSLGVL